MGFLLDTMRDEGIEARVHPRAINAGETKTDGLYCRLPDDNGPEVEYILWNNARPKREQQFTVAHELGHAFMGHLDRKHLENKQEELEANIFASVIIALSRYMEWKEKQEAMI